MYQPNGETCHIAAALDIVYNKLPALEYWCDHSLPRLVLKTVDHMFDIIDLYFVTNLDLFLETNKDWFVTS